MKKRNKKTPVNHTRLLIFILIVFALPFLFYIYSLKQDINKRTGINESLINQTKIQREIIKELKLDLKLLNLKQKKNISLIAKHIRQLSNPNISSRHIAKYIVKKSERLNYNPFLLVAIIHHESSFKKNAKSKAGAKGLMQVLPSTAKYMGYESEHLNKVGYNIRVGITYLKYLQTRFKKTPDILMAYNAGPTNLLRNNIQSGTIKYANNIISLTERFNSDIIIQ